MMTPNQVDQAELLLELEETLRETLAALRVCGCPARENFQRVWHHAQESAQRVLTKAARLRMEREGQ